MDSLDSTIAHLLTLSDRRMDSAFTAHERGDMEAADRLSDVSHDYDSATARLMAVRDFFPASEA